MCPHTPLRSVLLALACLLLATASHGYTELDASTFNDFVSDNPHSLVIFYAPWAEAWEKFEEHFEEIDEQMEDLPIEVGLVDIEEHTELSVESGKNTLSIKFFFHDRIMNPPITYFDVFYTERVMAFVNHVLYSMVDIDIDGMEEIAHEFMHEAIYTPVVDRTDAKVFMDKVKAKLDAEQDGNKQALLRQHLRVIESLSMETSNLSRNLHKAKEKLANHGHKMKIQDYTSLKNEISIYEMYSETLLPDKLKKKNQMKRKKLDEPKRNVAVDAGARANILF